MGLKYSEEVYEEKKNSNKNVLIEELELDKYYSKEEIDSIFNKLKPYFEHNSNERTLGRDPETLRKNIREILFFYKTIGLNIDEIIDSIRSYPSIIHSGNKVFQNYLLYSCLENEHNTERRDRLIKRAGDFIIDPKRTFARLRLMQDLNYEANWENLVKKNDLNFARIFVKSKHAKPYKIFKDVDRIMGENLKNMYPFDYNYLGYLMELDINKCFSSKVEEKQHARK